MLSEKRKKLGHCKIMKEEKLQFPVDSLPVLSDKVSVGISIIVFNRSRKVLLYQRKDLSWWGFPGGQVDNEESLKEAALRELKEETGIKATIEAISGIYLKTKGKTNIVFVFRGKFPRGKLLRSSDETKDCNWFSLKRARLLLSPNLRQRLEDALDKNVFYIRKQDSLPFKMWLDFKKRDLKNFFNFK
jgi:8-oxo-dGTP pyrophosphatase MutT (NUDIX family)